MNSNPHVELGDRVLVTRKQFGRVVHIDHQGVSTDNPLFTFLPWRVLRRDSWRLLDPRP